MSDQTPNSLELVSRKLDELMQEFQASRNGVRALTAILRRVDDALAAALAELRAQRNDDR